MEQEMGLIEDIVESKTSPLVKIGDTALWCFAAAFLVFGMMTASVIGMIIMAVGIAFGFAGWWFGRELHLEYEYSYFDKEIHFAKVFKKESRKDIETIRLEDAEIGGPIRSYHLDNHRNKDKDLKTSDYSSHMEKQPDPRYVLYFQGRRVVFEPSAEMVRAMNEKFPRKLYKD